MPTFGEMIKLGDLPEEEKEQIKDGIVYSAEHEGEFYTEVNKEPLDQNKTSMTFTRAYLPEIDKSSDRYINGLVEGVTPDPEKISEAEFSVPVKENGWYYNFTDKALNHAYNSIKERCTKFLANLFKSYHDEKIADAYLASANIVTGANLLTLADLLNIADILFVNGAVPFDGGFYKLKVAPEVATKMLVAYKDIITHTTQKEAIVNGEIGEIGGFRIIKSRLKAFKGTVSGSNTNYPFCAYGKTMKGEFPVSIVAYDDMNSKILFHNLGVNGNDQLEQRGSIGLKLDGHGFYVYDDSVDVCGVCAITGTDLAVSKFADSSRSHLIVSRTAASNLYPDVTNLTLKVGATKTLAVTDEDGTAIAAADMTYTSDKAAVATVSTAGVITAVAKGTAHIVIAKGVYVTVITVSVVSA